MFFSFSFQLCDSAYKPRCRSSCKNIKCNRNETCTVYRAKAKNGRFYNVASCQCNPCCMKNYGANGCQLKIAKYSLKKNKKTLCKVKAYNPRVCKKNRCPPRTVCFAAYKKCRIGPCPIYPLCRPILP